MSATTKTRGKRKLARESLLRSTFDRDAAARSVGRSWAAKHGTMAKANIGFLEGTADRIDRILEAEDAERISTEDMIDELAAVRDGLRAHVKQMLSAPERRRALSPLVAANPTDDFARMQELFKDLEDAAFECGAWTSDHDETYEAVLQRQTEARAGLVLLLGQHSADQFARRLKAAFPWLETNDEANGGDTVDQLNDLYHSLTQYRTRCG